MPSIARVNPTDAPAGDRYTWGQRLQALVDTWPVLLIFLVVIGGIYGGFFTPTEAAAIGTVATAFVAWRSNWFAWSGLHAVHVRHGCGHEHDLPDFAGCRRVERVPGAHATEHRTGQVGDLDGTCLR